MIIAHRVLPLSLLMKKPGTINPTDSKHAINEINSSNEASNKYIIELPLQKDIIGKLIKGLRKSRKYSQTRLGLLIGVQKAQVSKLEKSGSNITLATMIKVFDALKTKVSLQIVFDKKKDFKMMQKALSEEREENIDE